jgi:hypothetical protein
MTAASAPAAPVAATPGLTIQIVNRTGSDQPSSNGDPVVAPTFGSWQVAPTGPLANGATAVWVAQLGSDGSFLGGISYGGNLYLLLQVLLEADSLNPFSATCSTQNRLITCTTQNATKTTPWIVTWMDASDDATPPAVQVKVAPSLVEESVRAAGLPVAVRSNEPARARVELIAQNGGGMRCSPGRSSGATVTIR